MSDAESLLALIAVIYLSECAAWLPRAVVVFRSRWTKRWQPISADDRFGNAYGGLVFGNPLPPLGRWVMCQAWPLALSPDGVCGDEAEARPASDRSPSAAQSLAWDELGGAKREGSEVRVAGKRRAKAASSRQAASLVALLTRLAAAPQAKRGALIEAALAETTNHEAASRRVAETSAQASGLHWSANVLWFYLFTAGPMLVWNPTAWRYWPWLLAAMALAWWPIAWQFARAHRALYPDDRAGRIKHLAMILVSPPAAIRAHDVLWREAFTDFHPLAVARVLLSPADFADYARRSLLSMKFRPEAAAAEPPEAIAWYGQRHWAACVEVVEQAGISVDELLAPPTPETEQCRTYCPRCRNQFVLEQGVCEPCGGVRLVRW